MKDDDKVSKRIVLGSAQFGMDYGINNKTGRIAFNEVERIIDYAYSNDIDTIQTSYAYGTSEKVIGRYILSHPNKNIKIINKISSDEDCDEKFYRSLKSLNVTKVYGVMANDLGSINEDLLSTLNRMKEKGLADKIGFTLNYTHELDLLFRMGVKFDLIQIPFNIFDQRFKPYLKRLRSMGVEIHARSVFLQGLFFRGADDLDSQFVEVKDKIMLIAEMAKEQGVSIASLCIGFAYMHDVDKIVIGVDSVADLKENLEVDLLARAAFHKLKKLKVDNEDIMLPMRWRKDER